MSNINTKLENLANGGECPCGSTVCSCGREVMAAALLRARKLLSLWHSKAHEGAPCMRDELCPALDDTELEKAL